MKGEVLVSFSQVSHDRMHGNSLNLCQEGLAWTVSISLLRGQTLKEASYRGGGGSRLVNV